MLAFGLQVFGCNCFNTWMPAFMMRQSSWALSPSAAAFHSVFWCYLGSFAGIAAGARTSDGLAKARPGVRFSVMAAVLGWVGERFSLRTGFTIFAATFLLGSLAILVARFAFYGRDRITDDTKELS